MTTKEMVNATKNVAQKVRENPLSVVEDAMQAVEDVMFSVVSSDVTVLKEASRHILKAGGKRVRPRLVILSYLATGGNDLQEAAPVAAALELVHTASVVHDDINDHGVVRRGRPSVNAMWGRTFALLTGDYLFTKVYELMAPYGDLNMLFSEATTALVEGETLQAAAVKDKDFSREIYMEIIARKTAVLFKIGAMLGGNLNDAPKAQIEALEQYGYNIGLAFQIVDDILDIIGDEEELGKTAGLDLQQGKGFTAINENGDHAEDSAIVSDPMEAIKRKLMSEDRIDKAREQAQTLVEMGVAALDALPDSDYKDELINLGYSVINRQS